MKNCRKNVLKSRNGITLIALVITIIVLLILAGISISMLSGDNSILQKATTAKTETEKAQIIENAQTDILAQQTDNKGSNITKKQLATILNKYFETTETTSIPDEVSSEHDLVLTTIDEKYTINLSKIFKGRFANESVVETFGEKYEDTMIGKTIDFKSEKNNVNDWIILGTQTNNQGKNDIIITTKNPVSSQGINNYTLADKSLSVWTGYEGVINSACKTYVGEKGTLGTKSANMKEVRSIKLKDINDAVGFSKTINQITISNDNGGFAYPSSEGNSWVKQTDDGYSSYPFENEAYYYYNDNGKYKFGSYTNGFNNTEITLEKPDNMKYILANNDFYWVASRGIDLQQGKGYAYFVLASVGYGFINNDGDRNIMGGIFHVCRSDVSGGSEGILTDIRALRPVVILSSETPWDDVKNLIGGYAEY